MEQQRADAVIKSAKESLGAAVLLRCVGARETKGGAMRCEKMVSGSISNSLPLSVWRVRIGRPNWVVM